MLFFQPIINGKKHKTTTIKEKGTCINRQGEKEKKREMGIELNKYLI
jgi:hypothetical protein